MRAFVAVADELNFGRAATRLHIAQPAVTTQIKRLERELGVLLFERNNRVVRLTEAGEAFLGPCQAALDQIDRASLAAQSTGDGETGRVRIGFNVGFSVDPLVPLAQAVAHRHPKLQLEVDIPRTNREIAELVAQERLDLGLIGGADPGAGLRSLTIGWSRLCLIVPVGHEFAGRADVPLADVAGRPVILARSGPGTLRSHVEQLYATVGAFPQEVATIPDSSGVMAMVAAGVGIAFTMSSTSTVTPATMRLVPIAESPRYPVELIWKAGHVRPAMRRVIECATNLRDDNDIKS